ncbi:putative toxin-antitoxin system toxin component, PIN family [Candidatus Gottesmanbacteria bacterium]|nr:putative toxin-antitoxin system toxin component, PIN family [Candidatus Gottesmanbacteria bacterium]
MKVVLDTNVLFSAVTYDGIPAKILERVAKGEMIGVTSPLLIDEFFEILRKKSSLSLEGIQLLQEEFGRLLEVVFPRQSIEVCRDHDDNRVLEAAIEGDCDYIVTGDKDLLVVGTYQKTAILTPAEFLQKLG